MIIHLTTDFFWTDTSRIERWPEILKKLPGKIESKSRVDVAKDYLNYKTDEKGRILRADEVYGMFGLEQKKNKNIIVGCNLIVKGDKGYILSEDAKKIAEAYESDENWELLLAIQLLKYSIRVRAIAIGLINGEGINFKEGFLKNNKESFLVLAGDKYYIFNTDNVEKNLNTIMEKYKTISIGEFWRNILNFDEDESVEIEGIVKKEPSLKQAASYFKMPFMLFKHLGWIKEQADNMYVLDKGLVKKQVGDKIFNSLMIETFKGELDILKELILEHMDERGYFPVSIVGKSLKEKLDIISESSVNRWIDRYFMTGITEKKFRLVGSEQGQPRHGRGLFGDKDQQLIKLEF